MSYPYRNLNPNSGCPYPSYSSEQGTPPYPTMMPSTGYNPTMGFTAHLPEGYPTFSSASSPFGAPYGTSGSAPAPYGTSGSPYGTLGPAPAPYGMPGSAPSPYGTLGSAPAQYGASGSAPAPYDTPGSAPAPYGTPGSAPAPYGTPVTHAYPFGTSVTQTYPYGTSASAGSPGFMPQTSTYPPAPPYGSPAPTNSSGYPNYPRSSPLPSRSSPLPYQQSKNQAVTGMANYEGQGTVVPFPGFDPNQDAQSLRKAMKGFGTDEKAIIGVLAHRSNSQRVYIAVAFKQLYGKDLIDDLKSELSGRFEDVIVALMTPLNDYLAKEAHHAMSGVGTDEDTLIEILCTRTNQEIWGINEAYRRLYGKSIEDAISGDTSGHFRRLLISSCTGARSEAQADPHQAREDAQHLYKAGAGQWGTDESTFNAIMCSRSFHHLSLVFYEYLSLTGHSIVKAIESEMSGDLKKGMLAVARSVENRPAYFAEKLYRAMKGMGTDDRTLIRVVVSRCEIDMVQIRSEYERNYGKPLSSAIKDDISGDYKRMLITLVDG